MSYTNYTSYSDPTGVGSNACSRGIKRASHDISDSYIEALELRIQNLATTLATQEAIVDALDNNGDLTSEDRTNIATLTGLMSGYNTTLSSYNDSVAVIEAKLEGLTVTKSGETVTSVNLNSDLVFEAEKGIVFGDDPDTKQTTAVNRYEVESLKGRAGAASPGDTNWFTRLYDLEQKTAPLSITTYDGAAALLIDRVLVCNQIQFSSDDGGVIWGDLTVPKSEFTSWSVTSEDLAAVQAITDHFTYSNETLTLDLPLFVTSGIVGLYSLASVSESMLSFQNSSGDVTYQTTALTTSAPTHAETIADLFTLTTIGSNRLTLDANITFEADHAIIPDLNVGNLYFTGDPSPQTVPYIYTESGLPEGFTYDADNDRYIVSKPIYTNRFIFDDVAGQGAFHFNGKEINTFLTDAEIALYEETATKLAAFTRQGDYLYVDAESIVIQPEESRSLTMTAPSSGHVLINKPYKDYLIEVIHETQWVDTYALEPSKFLVDTFIGTQWVSSNAWNNYFNSPQRRYSFPTGHGRVGSAPASITDTNNYPPGFYTVSLHAGLSPKNYAREAISRVYHCIPRIKISLKRAGTNNTFDSKYFKGMGYQNTAADEISIPTSEQGVVTYTDPVYYGERYLQTNSCYQAITLTFSTDREWRLEYHSELYIRANGSKCHFGGALTVQRHGDVRDGWGNSTFLSAFTIEEDIEDIVVVDP